MNKVAVSLAPRDTEMCLDQLQVLAGQVSYVEICLDLMRSFDLPRIINASPCPLIITYRPVREGGQFNRSESERLDILRWAMELGCSYVDIEWDSYMRLKRPHQTSTRLIISRHWFQGMPERLWPFYEELRSQADVVKLVGMARRSSDVLPVFDLLKQARTPVISLAMGQIGQLTRLLAPCFESCFLTYAAPSPVMATAPGQLSVQQMFQLYHLERVDPQTSVHLYLCMNPMQAEIVAKRNMHESTEQRLHVPWMVSEAEDRSLLMDLSAYFQSLTIEPEIVWKGTN